MSARKQVCDTFASILDVKVMTGVEYRVNLPVYPFLDETIRRLSIHPIKFSVHKAHGDLNLFESLVKWLSGV